MSLRQCFFHANPKMRKRVWTAQARADRGPGNPQNRKKNNRRTTCKQSPTHTFDLNGKMSERLPKGSTFSRREALFFQGFGPWGPGGAKRDHKATQGRPRYPKGSPKGAQLS